MEVYKEMIESTIKEYCSVTNPKLVVRFANDVSGLEIDENGRVKSGASPENFVALVERMKKLFGPVAYMLARKAISDIIDEKIREKLPYELR